MPQRLSLSDVTDNNNGKWETRVKIGESKDIKREIKGHYWLSMIRNQIPIHVSQFYVPLIYGNTYIAFQQHVTCRNGQEIFSG